MKNKLFILVCLSSLFFSMPIFSASQEKVSEEPAKKLQEVKKNDKCVKKNCNCSKKTKCPEPTSEADVGMGFGGFGG